MNNLQPAALVLVLAVGSVAAACGGGDEDPRAGASPAAEVADGSTTAGGEQADAPAGSAPADDDPGAPTALTLVAADLEFHTAALTAPAGQPVTLTFENRDEGVPHNVHVLDAGEQAATEISTGPATSTLTFTIEAPGTYEYRCDVHPDMSGVLTVEA